jgi:hypothetical protein
MWGNINMKRIILILVILALCSHASANPIADIMSIMSADGEHGEIVHVPVNIVNVTNGPIQVIKLDVLYDHSILKLDYDNDDALLNGDLAAGVNWTFVLGTNEQSITLATSDQSQAIHNGSTGSVFLLNFTVIGTTGQTTPLELSDIEFSDPSGYNLGTAPAINGAFTVYKLGDVNGDGNITSVDALITLQMAVRGEYNKIADVNDDDRVTSLDALMIQRAATDSIIID